MISAFLISQILIGIAFVFDLASFQFKKREITLALFAISASLIAAHFFYLGATTAGFITVVSVARFVVSIFTQNPYVKYGALLLIAGLGFYTFDGYEDIFSILAGTFGTLSAFQKDERRLRVFMMFGTLSIITHNILIWTPAGILLEFFFLGSNLVSYYRFYIRKQPVS
ncbi:MAG: YgjV family protein [Minisyncoccia bacterium]